MAKYSPTMQPHVDIMEITPELAQRWLESNANNRKPSELRVQAIAEQIEKGKYVLVPDAIAFDTTGRLFNGQHRLYACIKAGKSIWSIVFTNASPDAFMVTDIGMRKNGKHTLDTLGYSNSVACAAAGRIVANIMATGSHYDGWTSIRSIPPNEVVAALSAYPAIPQYVADGKALTNGHDQLNVIATVVAVSLWYAAEHGHYQGLKDFLTRAASQVGLVDGSPELALRRRLANQPKNRNWVVNRENMAWIIKAYSLHLKGGKATTIVWKADESFPVLNTQE